MISATTYKALIITTFLSTVVVFLTFTIHIKKKSELVAETFFEMDTEELFEEEKEELEELEELLKSFDNITTNKAFNENQKLEELEDAEFEKRLEEIRNRKDAEEYKQEKKESEKESNPDENPAFKDINDIINKQKNRDNSNKNSSLSYSLVDRTHTFLPTPIYLCEYGGKIVVNITVNSDGNVTDAYVNNASASSNGCLIDHALEYAKASIFNTDTTKPSQLGSITFYFKGKN